MCCFLICFYNPNKFVSHTPRLEKGAVRQFRIAVCSQLRQGICCKAVAANKCRFPAVLQLRRHSGHHAGACTAATAPGRWGRLAELRATGERAGEQQPRVPASPRAAKDTVALHKASCRQRSLRRGIALLPPALPALALPAQRAAASPRRPGAARAPVRRRETLG